MISLNKGEQNAFYADIAKYDPEKDGDWDKFSEFSVLENLAMLESQKPEMQLDTSWGVEKIDGLEFKKFQLVSAIPQEDVMHSIMYRKLHKGYDLVITISYADEGIGVKLKEILKTSKFEK